MDFTVLSPEEIRCSYREAKDQEMQIEILCDLTLSTQKEMRDFLGIPNEIKMCIDREELEVEWKKLYDEGLSDRKIASLTLTTKGVVQHWRVKNGLPTKQTQGRQKKEKPPAERWHEVYRMGLTDKESGRMLGVSHDAFRHFRVKHGLKANGKRFEQ